MNKFIALLTDFGTDDGSAACLEAVIASINTNARVIHMSHAVPGWDISTAAMFLEVYFEDYPAGTVFVAVVDPGVGTDREPIMVKCGEYYFVGPDNGIFTRVLEKSSSLATVVKLESSTFWKNGGKEISTTFHGRDIFAPVAAHLTNGNDIRVFGPNMSVDALVRLGPFSHIDEDKLITKVLFIDRWGNLVIGVKKQEFLEFTKGKMFQAFINKSSITQHAETFADLPEDIPGLIFGGDFGEYGTIAMNMGNAAEFTCAEESNQVVIYKQDDN